MTTLSLNRVLHLMVPWRQSPFLASPGLFAPNSSGSPALGVQMQGWISKRRSVSHSKYAATAGSAQRSPSRCRGLRNQSGSSVACQLCEVPGARCYMNTRYSSPVTCGGGWCVDTSLFGCTVPGVCTKAQDNQRLSISGCVNSSGRQSYVYCKTPSMEAVIISISY